MRMSFSTTTNTMPLSEPAPERFASTAGSRKNRPIDSESATMIVPVHALPEQLLLVLGELRVGGDAERLEADRRATRHSATTPRTTGRRSSGALSDEHERERLDLISHWSSGASLGLGLADGDGPRGDAAHHHALEHRLAADRSVPLGDERPVGLACGLLGGHEGVSG